MSSNLRNMLYLSKYHWFTPFTATRFAMHRIYANRINSRGMSRVFGDLRSPKTPRGILPVNSNHNFLFFRKNHKNCLHSNNQYAIIRPVIRNSSQTKCPDSSVGRAEDWKSSCRWFDSGSGHFYFLFFAHGWLEKAWAFFYFLFYCLILFLAV